MCSICLWRIERLPSDWMKQLTKLMVLSNWMVQAGVCMCIYIYGTSWAPQTYQIQDDEDRDGSRNVGFIRPPDAAGCSWRLCWTGRTVKLYKLIIELNSMEQRLSWEAYSRPAVENFKFILLLFLPIITSNVAYLEIQSKALKYGTRYQTCVQLTITFRNEKICNMKRVNYMNDWWFLQVWLSEYFDYWLI
jgi:hypothetical protein